LKPISRTIAVWLATIIIIAGLSMGMLYSYASLERKQKEYLKHVNVEADFITHELGISLSAHDTAAIASISLNAINLSTVKAIRIMDEDGLTLYARNSVTHPDDIVLKKEIRYRNKTVGRIEITFTPLDPRNISGGILKMTFAILLPVILASILLISLILKIYLSDPLNALLKGIKSISDGHYQTHISVKRGLELGLIADSVNRLSEKLYQRERTLKENEKKLKESLEKYKVLFSAFPLAITVADAGGVIIESNARAEALLGISRQNHEGQSIGGAFWKIIRPDGTVMPQEEYASVRALRERRLIRNQEQGFVRPDGDIVWLNVTAAPLPLDGRGIVIAYGDITEQKRDKERLKQLNANLEKMVSERTALSEKRAEQLRELTIELSVAEDRERRRLAAALHDDLQQHLAYIRVRTEIAAAAPVMSPDIPIRQEIKEIEALVRESIHKCRNLCYDLTPAELYRDGLLPALERAVDDFRQRYGLKIEFSATPDSRPSSIVLASMLYRSIKELLTNIAKHAGVNTAALDIRCEDGWIIVNVTDRGKGCDLAEVRARKGTEAGFGLFNIADRMTFLGGHVDFASAKGDGFHTCLKVPKDFIDSGKVPEPPPSADNPTRIGASDSRKHEAVCADTECIRIMVVDDHDLMRAGLVELLQRHKDLLVVGEAANGLEAIRLAAELTPDVILMDVSMPEMDGIGASTEICRIQPGVRIIGISMSRDASTRQRMFSAGACAFLSKAGSFDELIEVIRANAARRRPKCP